MTGSRPARMAGIGGTLLLAGLVSYLLARRRTAKQSRTAKKT